MRKKTRDELDRLRKDVNDLNLMVWAIAQAAGVMPIRVPEQQPSTRWVHQDSAEWKAEVTRRQNEVNLLKTMAQAQQNAWPSYISPQGPHPGETIWP